MSTMSGQLMTPELLKAALPKNLHGNATPQFAAVINQLALDPETCDEVRSNFMTFSKVLVDGKYKTEDYLNAVVYSTHKLMGYSNKDAYIRSFPDRYQALVARGAKDKDISAYVAAYSKNKLVIAILEQALVPAHLLYQDVFNKAIETQVRLMTTASSEKVQQDAANSILTHLKAPETKKVELDVSVKQTGGIDDLRRTMEELAQRQTELISAGVATAGQMARAPIMMTQQEKDEAIDGVLATEIEPTCLAEVAEPCLDPVYQGADPQPPEITAAPAAVPAEPDVPDPDPEWMTGGAPRGAPAVTIPAAPGRSLFELQPVASTPAPAAKPRVSLFGD